MVPLQEQSYSPGPLKGVRDTFSRHFKTLLKSTKSEGDSCDLAALICGPLPPPGSPLCSALAIPLVCFSSFPRFFVCVFWDTSPAPFSTCCENISSGMFLDGPLLMGSCLANNKVLELSSASATP